ncbi:MAG: hypothetical protein IKU14_02065 [Rhodocyclaceae bacterium]|nr:hypothetical protein [Rhodocyclaceae bacterium]
MHLMLALLLLPAALIIAPVLELLADARPGKQGRWMYVVSSALWFAAFLPLVLWLFPQEPVSGAFLCALCAFYATTALCKARKGARLKRMGEVLGLVSHALRARKKLSLHALHPRHWLPVYQPWALYRAGEISRFEWGAALAAYGYLALMAWLGNSPHKDTVPAIVATLFCMACSLDFLDDRTRPASRIPAKRLGGALMGMLMCIMFCARGWEYLDVSSAAAGVACGLFFLVRIAHSRAALLRTPSGRTQWHAFFGALLCGAAFCLMATAHSLSRAAQTQPASLVQSLEFLLLAFCLFGYPLRKLAFFLLFQCLEPLWLRWRNRQSFRAAYLRVRSQCWFEGIMALLAIAALVRAASADVAALAVLHLACFALLMTPLALRITQRRRRI